MNISQMYKKCKDELKSAGVEDYFYDAAILAEHFLHMSRKDILTHPEKKADSKDAIRFFEAVERRKCREPLQYIIGEWEFMGHKFDVGYGVLIPREDTELLVRTAARVLRPGSVGVDLCAGSAAVAIGISGLVGVSEITAIEKSAAAFSYLERNIKRYDRYNIKGIKGDITLVADRFEPHSLDFIVSNPPYVMESEWDGLQDEVKREPREALLAGQDGLDFYREIVKNWKDKLKPDGILAVEIGETQADAVTDIFKNAGFASSLTYKDMAGNDRVILSEGREK